MKIINIWNNKYMESLLEKLELADQNATLWINSLNSPISDKIWLCFSDRLLWLPLYILILGLLIKKLGWKKGLISVIVIALSILCIDQLCNLIKLHAHRLRPCNDPSMIERGLHMLAGASTRHPYGFFSAHAANAMGFAVAASILLDKKAWKIILPLWAILVGLSRVFVGKHFLGEILVGLVVGTLIGAIFARLLILLFNSRTTESSSSTL